MYFYSFVLDNGTDTMSLRPAGSALCDSTCRANIGQGTTASAKDLEKIRRAYGCPAAESCGGHWSGDSGSLAGVAGAGEAGCEWVIRATEGKEIIIVFSSFSVGKCCS